MRILFTGVGRRVELIQAFRDAALALDVNLRLYGADMAGTAPALAFCDFTRTVVGMNDPSYIENLLSICAEDNIDLLIPTIDTDLLVLSKNKSRFETQGTKVLVSSLDKIRICRDKNLTSQFFVDCGLHAPMPVRDWREYRSGYPAFIKPKDGSSSVDAYKIENEAELKSYASRVKDYIVQPFIDGTEYTIDIFCDWSGNPVSIVPRERIQVRAGEVLKTRICLDRQMVDEAKALCKAFAPCGPITVQLIRDGEGVDWFIEINPRFGGGAPLSMKAGARSAESILRLLLGRPTPYIEEVANDAIYSRFDQSVCIRDGKSQIRGIIFDLDDTLYPEKQYVRSGFDAVSGFLGGDYTAQLWKLFEAGKPAITCLTRELGLPELEVDALRAYRSHVPDIHLRPSVKKLLVQLRSKGIRLGIITDGRPEGQRAKISALGLGGLVDDIVITDELGGTQFRKPCDIAFRIIQRRWRIPYGRIAYVGDNPIKDFQAPRQLGMKCVWVRNIDGIYSMDEGLDYVSCVLDVADLMGVIDT